MFPQVAQRSCGAMEAFKERLDESLHSLMVSGSQAHGREMALRFLPIQMTL